MLATYRSFPRFGSTIMLKRSPVTQDDIDRFTDFTAIVGRGTGTVDFTWQTPRTGSPYDQVVRADLEELEDWYEQYAYEIRPATDDAPFFWHVVRFRTALEKSFEPIKQGHESGVGERLLLFLLVIMTFLGATFLFAPLLLRREVWRELPAKVPAAVYFAAIGTGFMFFEVSLIQRLTLFLGYPTYSLTVTLFAILLSTGVGSLVSERLPGSIGRLLGLLGLALLVLVSFYTLALAPLIGSLVGSPLPLRVLVTVVVLAPLGVCLGAFMPVGVRTIAALSPHAEEYVAWAWAINGFFSVISSLLSSLLSMMIGFTMVMWIALAIYAIAIGALARIIGQHSSPPSAPGPTQST